MPGFKLHLLKHPNTLENGRPVDSFDIEAASLEEAHAAAVAHINNSAPKEAFEKPADVFILVDEDGYELSRWGPENLPEG